MKNKILISLIVPDLDEEYYVYIPINKKIGNVINLLSKAVNELNDGIFCISSKNSLYDRITGEKYSVDKLVRETNIRNSSSIVLM